MWSSPLEGLLGGFTSHARSMCGDICTWMVDVWDYVHLDGQCVELSALGRSMCSSACTWVVVGWGYLHLDC